MDKKRVGEREFCSYGVVLQPVRPHDLPLLRRWRNSPRIRSQMIDTSYIGPRKQRMWYEGIVQDASQAHWVAYSQEIRVGYVNLKGAGPLDEQTKLDGGIYVGEPNASHRLLGFALALMQLKIVFEVLEVPLYQTCHLAGNLGLSKFNKIFNYIFYPSKRTRLTTVSMYGYRFII